MNLGDHVATALQESGLIGDSNVTQAAEVIERAVKAWQQANPIEGDAD